MKFWQLISIFRHEKEILKEVLDNSKWFNLKVHFDNYDELVRIQNRTILDTEIPFDLAKEVCEKSQMKFYLYQEGNQQILRSHQLQNDKSFEIIFPLEILFRYDGGCMEETLEKGSTIVQLNRIG